MHLVWPGVLSPGLSDSNKKKFCRLRNPLFKMAPSPRNKPEARAPPPKNLAHMLRSHVVLRGGTGGSGRIRGKSCKSAKNATKREKRQKMPFLRKSKAHLPHPLAGPEQGTIHKGGGPEWGTAQRQSPPFLPRFLGEIKEFENVTNWGDELFFLERIFPAQKGRSQNRPRCARGCGTPSHTVSQVVPEEPGARPPVGVKNMR